MSYLNANRTGWADLALATAPATTPITLIQAKVQCRIDHNDDDVYIGDLINAATAMIDGPDGAGISLITQQWRLSLDVWPNDAIILPLGPVQSVDSITWTDLTGATQTLLATQYKFDLDARPVRIRRAFGVVWPILGIIPGAVKVSFTTGFGVAPANVPADLRMAMLLLISHWYEHRDAVVGVEGRDSSTITPLGWDAVLDKYRVGRFA